jgi:hypothetical protein
VTDLPGAEAATTVLGARPAVGAARVAWDRAAGMINVVAVGPEAIVSPPEPALP